MKQIVNGCSPMLGPDSRMDPTGKCYCGSLQKEETRATSISHAWPFFVLWIQFLESIWRLKSWSLRQEFVLKLPANWQHYTRAHEKAQKAQRSQRNSYSCHLYRPSINLSWTLRVYIIMLQYATMLYNVANIQKILCKKQNLHRPAPQWMYISARTCPYRPMGGPMVVDDFIWRVVHGKTF